MGGGEGYEKGWWKREEGVGGEERKKTGGGGVSLSFSFVSFVEDVSLEADSPPSPFNLSSLKLKEKTVSLSILDVRLLSPGLLRLSTRLLPDLTSIFSSSPQINSILRIRLRRILFSVHQRSGRSRQPQ